VSQSWPDRLGTGLSWFVESSLLGGRRIDCSRKKGDTSIAALPVKLLLLNVGHLRGNTSTAGRTADASSPRRAAPEPAASGALAARAASVEASSAPARDAATVGVVVASTVRVGLGAARLDDDVLPAHVVRVGRQGGLICRRGSELDESAVLIFLLAASAAGEERPLTLVRLISK